MKFIKDLFIIQQEQKTVNVGNRNISQYFPMTNHVPGSIIKIIIDFVRIHFEEDFEKSFGKIQSDKVNHYAGENHFFQKNISAG